MQDLYHFLILVYTESAANPTYAGFLMAVKFKLVMISATSNCSFFCCCLMLLFFSLFSLSFLLSEKLLIVPVSYALTVPPQGPTPVDDLSIQHCKK